jgi:hypothetical protein
MPMKILKDAGVVPAEIEWFHERARLKASIEAASDPAERRPMQLKLIELEQKIALRLERLRLSSTL